MQFISLDLETTGFDATKDKIIEFGAVKFDLEGNQQESLQFLCTPGFTLPQLITHITKITDQDLKGQPHFSDKLQEAKDFIGDLPIVGHNISFDTQFLRNNDLPIRNDEYDTHIFASIVMTGLPSYSLEILSKILNLSHAEKHRALDDAIAAKELFLRLIERFSHLDRELIKKIQTLSQKSNWPFKNLFEKITPIQNDEKSGVASLRGFPMQVLHSINESSGKDKVSSGDLHGETSLTGPQIFQEILNFKQSCLIETLPPYNKLAIDLANHAPNNYEIALPYTLFTDVGKEIPDTVAKIDSQKNYLSLKRLKEFEEKDFYENYEISSLCKYLIWSKETKTGMFCELTLKGEEYKTLEEVNINESINNPQAEFFFEKALQKEQASPSILTHQFLIESTQSKNPNHPEKNLIIIDLERFLGNFQRNLGIYLNVDHLLTALQPLQKADPGNSIIEDIKSKSTILFGLIGIIFESANDQDLYTPRSIVTNQIITTVAWNNTKKTLANLIELSKEIGHLNTEKNLGYLKRWKKILQDLYSIFIETKINENFIWIERDMQQNLILRSTPISTKKHLNEILDQFKSYQIIEECLDIKDEGKFIKALSGLNEHLPIQKLQQKNENLEISIAQDVDNSQKELLPKFFIKYFQNQKKKSAIIFNSKKELEFITLKLSQAELPIISQSSGSIGKMKELFRTAENSPILLMTIGTWLNFEDYDEIDQLFIHKIPFDAPSKAEIFFQSQNFEDGFKQLQIPRAIIALKKCINRMTKGNIAILDSRLIDKEYGQLFIKNLENIGQIKILKLKDLFTGFG